MISKILRTETLFRKLCLQTTQQQSLLNRWLSQIKYAAIVFMSERV